MGLTLALNGASNKGKGQLTCTVDHDFTVSAAVGMTFKKGSGFAFDGDKGMVPIVPMDTPLSALSTKLNSLGCDGGIIKLLNGEKDPSVCAPPATSP